MDGLSGSPETPPLLWETGRGTEPASRAPGGPPQLPQDHRRPLGPSFPRTAAFTGRKTWRVMCVLDVGLRRGLLGR